MAKKPNPKDVDAVIIFKDNKPDRVVPDVVDKHPGEAIAWMVLSGGKTAIVDFQSTANLPLDWAEPSKSGKKIIKGKVKPDAKTNEYYKYVVEDDQGDGIDPRVRVY